MPKTKVKGGVSKKATFSQPGPQGGIQTTILNQPALACHHKAATKVYSDILKGVLYLGCS